MTSPASRDDGFAGRASAPSPGPAASPTEAARAWVRAVMDAGDLATAWTLTDPDLRVVLAQHWVLSHEGDDVVGPPEGWEALARDLARCPSAHPLWERFAAERLARWRQFWRGFSARSWGLRDTTELIGRDIEVVTFVEPRGKLMRLQPGPPLELRRLAVRRRKGGWMVAGLDGAALYRPGWPPTRVGDRTP